MKISLWNGANPRYKTEALRELSYTTCTLLVRVKHTIILQYEKNGDVLRCVFWWTLNLTQDGKITLALPANVEVNPFMEVYILSFELLPFVIIPTSFHPTDTIPGNESSATTLR